MFSYSSDRTFALFSYTAANHGPLLLRSNKSDRYRTRIDILIADVRAMELRCWFTGVQIEEVNPSHITAQASNPSPFVEPGTRVYAVRGDDWNGFVLGGNAFVREDEGEYTDPSGLLPQD